MRSFQRFAWLVYCVSLSLTAGQQMNAPPPSATGGVPDHRLTLDVVVTDKPGQPFPGLQERNFTVTDQKQPQKILSFEAIGSLPAANPPVEIVLLIDAVNASLRSVAIERQQIEKFFRKNGGHLAQPVSLIFFSDSGARIGQAPSRDGNALIADMAKNETGLRQIRRSQGFYGALERANLSLRTLGQLADYEATKPGRKIVIWVSPGWPLLSGPHMQLSSKDQDEIFNSVIALSNSLRKARITLYSVDPLGTGDAGQLRTVFYQQFLKGVRSARKTAFGDLGLQVLAQQSGGLVLNSSNDLTGEIERCVGDADAFYTLSVNALPGDGPNEYHQLEVQVDRPGLAARTRNGYYAQPLAH